MDPDRIQRLVQLTANRGVDCVAVMPGSNLRYLAGLSFRLSERPTLAFFSANARPAAVVPSFEVSRFTAGSASIQWELFSWPDEAGPVAAFAAAASALSLTGKTLAIEENVLRVRELRLLEASAPGVHFASAEPILTAMRIRKDTAEVAKMRQAVSITEGALEAVLPDIRVGMSERSIAENLTAEMKRRGAEALAFDVAVVSGLNTALPHGQPSDRKLQAGDLLLFDFGVTVDGYASDITRTVAIGEVGAELRRVYDVVRQANEAGRAAARPGVEIQEVDRAARKVIVEAGFGSYFTHRTGHGLGLDIHEAPYACEGDTTILEPGMTFTVEPGIYLPGKGGVRIEDDVLITLAGSESLTTFDRELIVL